MRACMRVIPRVTEGGQAMGRIKERSRTYNLIYFDANDTNP